MKLEQKKHLTDKNMVQTEYGNYTNLNLQAIRIGTRKNHQVANGS